MFVQTEFNKPPNNNNIDVTDIYVNSETLLSDLDVIGRFLPICNRDMEAREAALDIIIKTIENWLDGVDSPKHYSLYDHRHHNIRTNNQRELHNNCSCSDYVGNNIREVSRENRGLIVHHLPIILRLSINCPFKNVRDKCQHILDIVRVSKKN